MSAFFLRSQSFQPARRRFGSLLVLVLMVTFASLAAAAQTTTTTTLAVTTGTIATTTTATTSITTLTATVTAGASTPTRGQIKFCDATEGTTAACIFTHILGTVQMIQSGGNAGKAIYRLSPTVGSHNFYAVYLPNTLYTTSTSAAQPYTISGSGTTAAAIAQSGSVGNYNLTATVTGTLGSPPAGTVDFLDESANFNQLGSATLVTGTPTATIANTSNPPVTGYPQSIVSADFNGDGLLDLAVGNADTSNVEILLGAGAGEFSPVLDGDINSNSSTPSDIDYVATGSGPTAMATGDFNGDGKPDVIVASGNGSYTVLLGQGNGAFTATTYSVSSLLSGSPVQLAVGDFNGDGFADVAIASSGNNAVVILLGNGNGTFAASSTPSNAGNPYAVAVGDFNGDGKQDLAVGGLTGAFGILLGNGDGTFAIGQNLGQGGATSLVVGDFNGDGIADIADVNNGGSLNIVSMQGKGDGTFTVVQDFAPNDLESFYITGGDFNGDGLTDLAITGQGEPTGSTRFGLVTGIALAKGDGTFNAPRLSPANAGLANDPSAIAAGDFNNDGVPDVVAVFPYNSESSGPAGSYDDLASVYLTSNQTISTATVAGINPVGTGTHNVSAFYQGQGLNNPSSSATTALTGSGLLTNTITFSQPASPVAVNGTATLNATSTSGAVLYTVTAGTATISGSTITYMTGGTVQITASSPASGNYAAATPVTVTVVVSLPQSTASWLPSTLSIYTGTVLSAGILDATDSIPASLSYSDYLLSASPSSATTASVGTQLSQGRYGLTANITPTSTNYASQTLTIPFTVQNMNVFTANSTGSVASLYNNGTVESSAITGGGIGAAVDSNGFVWSIGSGGNSLSKFTDVGAFSKSFTPTGFTGASALAIDGNSNIWVASSNGVIFQISNTGTATSTTTGSTGAAPSGVAIDSSGNVWVANSTANTVDEIIGGAAPAATLANAVQTATPGMKP